MYAGHGNILRELGSLEQFRIHDMQCLGDVLNLNNIILKELVSKLKVSLQLGSVLGNFTT